ncbi:MAG: flagellar basal body rod protein FlgB [Sulfuricurvum sp.]
MSLYLSKVNLLASQALDYRAIRQDLIASNLANIDTPYYRSRDISFDQTLLREKQRIMGDKNSELKLAKTDGAHLDPLSNESLDRAVLFFRDGHLARNDGNSVDLDVETSEMSKNSIMYNALVGAMKKNSGILRNAIDTAGRLQ